MSLNLPKLLYNYADCDYPTQLRVRFYYYVCISSILIVFTVMSYTYYNHTHSGYHFHYIIPILLAEALIAVFFSGCLLILIQGHHKLASHFLLISALSVVWFVILVDRKSTVIRTDTIAFIFAALSLLPLLVLKFRIIIPIYIIPNIVLLFFLTHSEFSSQKISYAEALDFFADNTMAFVFIGIVAYNTYRINSLSLSKLEHDYQERLKAEAALYKSEIRYKELTDLLPQTVYETDFEGNLLYMNEYALKQFGYSKETFPKNMNVLSVIAPESRERALANMKSLIDGREIRGNEYLALRSDGTQFPVVVYASLIKEENRYVGLRGVIFDLTERKKMEDELEAHRQNLEELVIQRTAELEKSKNDLESVNEFLHQQREQLQNTLNELNEAQRKLVESEKMASLGILSAGIAHEINNPLNFIQGGISGIKSYLGDVSPDHLDKVSPLISGIQVGVDRVSAIVKSLNHFSRDTKVMTEEVLIHPLLENCLQILQSQYKHRIEVFKDYCDCQVTVIGNDGELHQAILNIIANAIQSIHDEGEIRLKTWTENHTLRLQIRDNGDGIEEDNLPRIFDPFFTTKEPGKGTGLGLSITYRIIKEHRGEIEIFSEKGKGTSFTVVLPLSPK